MARSSIRLGQYPDPLRTIVHLSDTHLLAAGGQLHGTLTQERTLERALVQLERSDIRPDAIVVTGDLADLAEDDAYRRLRELVDPVVARLGTRVIWVPGNHDERGPFLSRVLGEDGDPTTPVDRVHDLDGLRVIALDSTVEGYHHGEIEPAQLEWLAAELAEPAPLGTILALHHPPIPTPIGIMEILELKRQEAFAEVIRGTDVRAILAGHLHYKTHSLFAGVPVSVAAATCYTIDTSERPDALAGVDGGQSYDVVDVFADRLVHTTVPVGDFRQVSGFTPEQVQHLASLSEHERLEAFSRKPSTDAPSPDA